jgi:hypothetical protein
MNVGMAGLQGRVGPVWIASHAGVKDIWERVSDKFEYLSPRLHSVTSEYPFIIGPILLSRKGAQGPAVFSSWDRVAFSVDFPSKSRVDAHHPGCTEHDTDHDFVIRFHAVSSSAKVAPSGCPEDLRRHPMTIKKRQQEVKKTISAAA